MYMYTYMCITHTAQVCNIFGTIYDPFHYILNAPRKEIIKEIKLKLKRRIQTKVKKKNSN